MAQVTLSIGGYGYNMVCRDGEEDHFLRLGAMVDSKAKQAISAVGSASETRQLMLAALLLADELNDVRAGSSTSATPASAPVDLAPIERLADRLEALARKLEDEAG